MRDLARALAALALTAAAVGCQASHATPSPSPLPPVKCAAQHNCQDYP